MELEPGFLRHLPKVVIQLSESLGLLVHERNRIYDHAPSVNRSDHVLYVRGGPFDPTVRMILVSDLVFRE